MEDKVNVAMPPEFAQFMLTGEGPSGLCITFKMYLKLAQPCPFILYCHWLRPCEKNMGNLSKVNDPGTNILN